MFWIYDYILLQISLIVAVMNAILVCPISTQGIKNYVSREQRVSVTIGAIR